MDAVLSTGAVTVKVTRKLHASDFDKDECKQFLPDMNKRDCMDCGHANSVGRDPRKGYRLTGESLGSVASRRENLRLWANDTTDAGKYALLHSFTFNRIMIDILILFIIHSFIYHTFTQMVSQYICPWLLINLNMRGRRVKMETIQ